MITKITAHRGYTKNFPENTLISFKEAFRRKADRIEFDVHLTKDRKLIIHHDYYIKVNNKETDLIFNRDAKMLRTIDVGDGNHMPFLEEVLETFKKNIEYEIELKGFDVFFIKQIIKTVKKFNLLNYVEFTSYPNYLISILKNYEKRARVGVFVSSYPSWMSALLGEKIILENLTLGKIDIAHCPINILNKKFIKDLKKRNILTHGADCNTAEDLRQAFLLKVNQLSTNDLDLAQKVRKKYGKI